MERSETRYKALPLILDHHGWGLGITAALKQVFGTNTEMRMQHGGMEKEVAHARREVGRMSDEAESLMMVLETNKPISDIEQAFEAIVKDL